MCRYIILTELTGFQRSCYIRNYESPRQKEVLVDTAMEESKATSGYVYEDEFSYVNEDYELFLKKGEGYEERKLGEVEENAIQDKVESLKKAYEAFSRKVDKLEEQEEIEEEKLVSLEEEIRSAEIIGDIDKLLERLGSLNDNGSAPDSETETTEEAQSDTASASEETGGEQDQSEEGTSETDGIGYYQSILEKAQNLAAQDDWPYVTAELEKLEREWGKGPGLEDEDTEEQLAKLYGTFTDTVDQFEKKKTEHYEKVKKQREQNLQSKKDLLAELGKIVEDENWTATGNVSKIKGKWNSIGSLPSGEGAVLDERFDELIGVFNGHKVDRLVQQRQKEEDNLMLKLSVLDKMEKVVSSIDESTSEWKDIDDKFEDLTTQWKKIGRVPSEKANEVWQRYKAAQDDYYDKKYNFDNKHRKYVDKFRSKKEKICSEAEALLEEEDIAKAARKINKLHRRWKKAGTLPQRDEDELWGRFKSATDAFNQRKSDNMDKLHEQEEEHYRQKLELIAEAEAIKDTTEWDKGHSKMQSLMDKWKKIGPVPKKKSNKIWKQFKGAMDVFYDRRREHFASVKEERKDNLKEKEEILEKLRELGQHEDPMEAVNIAKELQEKFKDAGYVPIKKKNKIWKEYRKACDVIYERFRAAKSGNKFDQELAKADLNPKQRSRIQDLRKEYNKIKKEVSKLESEVIQFQETKTYFKPSGKSNALLEEVHQKIEKAEKKLQKKQDELDEISQQMEEIKADG